MRKSLIFILCRNSTEGTKMQREELLLIKTNTEIANAMAATDEKAQYDEHAKRLLAQKSIVSHISESSMEEEKQKLLDGFRLLDDNFMTVVFDRNIEATTFLLNTILERDDLIIKEVVTQREYKNPVTGGRSIILDVYAVDAEEKVYDIEIQRSDGGADVHRARFHSSMLDTKLLKAQQKFNEIHDSYVIFITENDVMGMGLPLYHIEKVVRESGKRFDDGSHIVYVNGSYKNDDNLIGKVLHDFRCTNAADMYCPELAKPVRYFKEERGRGKMCKAMEEYAEKRAIRAVVDTCREFSLGDEMIITKIMEKYNLTEEQAKEYVYNYETI